MLKKAALGIMALLIIVGIAASYLWSNLDLLVKDAIEKYGNAATQTTVDLKTVRLSLASGEGTLSGLTIGSPSGFTAPSSFYLGSISVKVDPQSVTGNGPMIIKDLTITSPQITYEMGASGKTNLQTIIHNAQNYAGTSQQRSKPDTDQAANDNERKLIINSLTISNGQILIIQPHLKHPLTAMLPTIHMENIGKNNGGVSPAEIAQLLLGTVSENTANAAKQNLVKTLANIKDLSGNLIRGATDNTNSSDGSFKSLLHQ